MALDINASLATFKMFTDFATQAKGGSSIAQIGGEKNTVAVTGPLAGRTIVAKTAFDFVGNVGRRQESRDVNNDVRELFKQAIADLFHGESNIPMSVLDAMKLADFGKGKPLTARRIMAVKEAIVQALTEENEAVKEANENLHTGMQSCDPISKSGMPAEFADELRNILTEAQRRYIGEPSGEPTPTDFVRGGAQKLISKMVKTANAEGRRRESARRSTRCF